MHMDSNVLRTIDVSLYDMDNITRLKQIVQTFYQDPHLDVIIPPKILDAMSEYTKGLYDKQY
jgi:hypothetical protein